MSKISRIFIKFFSLKNTKLGDQLLLITYFDNFDFQCTLSSKNVPKFWSLIPNQFKSLLWPFSKTSDLTYSPLNSIMLSCSSEVTLGYVAFSENLNFTCIIFDLPKNISNCWIFWVVSSLCNECKEVKLLWLTSLVGHWLNSKPVRILWSCYS